MQDYLLYVDTSVLFVYIVHVQINTFLHLKYIRQHYSNYHYLLVVFTCTKDEFVQLLLGLTFIYRKLIVSHAIPTRILIA